MHEKRVGKFEACIRYYKMLMYLPRHPIKKTVKEISHFLETSELSVSERTVQRDLEKLSASFNITNSVGEDNKTHLWSWGQDADTVMFPLLDAATAISVLLAMGYMKSIIPSSQQKAMEIYRNYAQQALQQKGIKSNTKDWLEEKIAIIPSNQVLLAPNSPDQHVIETLYEALYNDKQVEISYHKPWEESPVSYPIHPLALVSRANVVYLVVFIKEYPEPRILALHRIKTATALDLPCKRGRFNLQSFIEEGQFGFADWGEIELRLRVSSFMKNILAETPLGVGQGIIPDEDDEESHILSVKLADTLVLRQWLLSQGNDLEVLAPEPTRQWIAEQVRDMQSMYSKIKQET